MDNSSIHTSEEFEEQIPQWKKQGLLIKYFIPYAPELNLIEILWRHIKYLWLPFSVYQGMEALRGCDRSIPNRAARRYKSFNQY